MKRPPCGSLAHARPGSTPAHGASPGAGTSAIRQLRPIPCGTRRRAWRLDTMPVLAVPVVMIALLAGCASSATAGPSAPLTRSPAAGSVPAAALMFTSRYYGYTEALPAGWTGVQATQNWNGTGAPGDQDNVVDLFHGPGGVEAWAIAAPTNENLAAYTRTTTRATVDCRAQSPAWTKRISAAAHPGGLPSGGSG
jgi:hypothetical protein